MSRTERYQLTDEHRARLPEYAEYGIRLALRTDPQTDNDRERATAAVRDLYHLVGLPAPRVVFAPSPLVARFGSGFAAEIWRRRDATATDAATHHATYDGATAIDATERATYDASERAIERAARAATEAATAGATYAATAGATDRATYAATVDVTDRATYAATVDVTERATYAATVDVTERATYAATAGATNRAIAGTGPGNSMESIRAIYDATAGATNRATVDATRAATYDATDAATRDATRDATRAATYDATYDVTYAATADATADATHATADATRATTWYAGIDLRQIVELADQLGIGARGLRSAIDAWQIQSGGNMWAGWVAHMAWYRDVAELQIDWEPFRIWQELAETGGYRSVHREFVVISDFPTTIRRDSANRPHCSDGPAIAWRDGTCCYSWHGIRVPQWLIEHPEQITVSAIASEGNAEVRRVMIERYGWARYLADTGARPISEAIDEGGQPMELYDAEGVRRLRLRNSTLDPDGTRREYLLRVPADLSDVWAARNWVCRVPADTRFEVVS